MSTVSSANQKLKIYGITKLKTDFILMSDIRLGSKNNGSSNLSLLEKTFLVNPYCGYKLYANSTQNSRGVGILAKQSLNVAVLAEARDPGENFLALRISLAGSEFILVSIYGPNKNDPSYFLKLADVLQEYSQIPIIIGGDWNCTFSCNALDSNPDICDMVRLPNITHSKLVHELAVKFNLSDPFRCFHPNRRDFSYTPRAVSHLNRSRIDFFLISESLVPFAYDCYIAQNLQNSLFDHKAVFLSFVTKNVDVKKPSISNYVLNDPLVGQVVTISTIECHIHHILPSRLPERKTVLLQKVGTARALVREIGADDALLPAGARNAEDLLKRETKIGELNQLIDELDVSNLQHLDLNVSGDIFLEYLINCIRNDLVSYQTFISKTFNDTKNNLIEQLNCCKSSEFLDAVLLRNLEKNLNELIDLEMKNEFEKYRKFELLNSEKITPYFIKMAKCAKPDALLSEIKNENGNEFLSKNDRDEYIVKYYEKLYTKPVTEKENLSGCIEEFLGPEILAHPIVQSSILTKTERDKLEKPLTIFELDEAVKLSNKNSAAGGDGISGKFITKFWPLLRRPLLNYAQECFKKGILSDTFRTANIRLIPKKGDLSNIKNWRPISLLSNLYKIISRALSNRLKTTTDRITSRAQKGFTSSRYLQEVLINVIEFIGHCNAEEKDAVIISVDYAKAFDTISNNFMSECYRFFGMGPTFRNMLETVGTNRRASIILDNFEMSRTFNLEAGRPQGDNLSPPEYNIGQQIVIFRLELDRSFQSVFQHFMGPQLPFPLPNEEEPHNAKFVNESCKQTNKVEGFADDTTTLGMRSTENILSVKKILNDFTAISGLHCNFSKTSITPVGSKTNMSIEEGCGLKVANSFVLLGMNIDNKLETLHSNFDTTIKKMENVVNFWVRFKLSLPGRIAIAKTFLLSLVNHIGCILMPTNNQLDKMQVVIDKFCIGSLNISRDRLYLQANKGGLGLINIREFLMAQHVMWVKRALHSSRDNWRVDMSILSHGNALCLNPKNINKIRHPILFGLAESFFTFNGAFSNLGVNYEKAFIFNNPAFERSKLDSGLLDKTLFSKCVNLFALVKLRFEDCFVRGELKSMFALNNEYGLNFTQADYFKLCSGLFYKRKTKKNVEGVAMSMGDFLLSFKKGSKSCRKILEKACKKNIDLQELQIIKTFSSILNISRPTEQTISKFLHLWNLSFIPNRLREFIFKFYNNKLGLNTRTAHFGGGTRLCTFCTILGMEDTDESFVHLFFECEAVATIHDNFDRHLLQIQQEAGQIKKCRWFGCQDLEIENQFLRLFHVTVQYFIWEAKLKMRIPSVDYILAETVLLLDDACSLNFEFDNCRMQLNCVLSRHWNNIRALARRW